ncbi:hypothetical protein JOB18_016626, partial [Solea senegalensis]
EPKQAHLLHTSVCRACSSTSTGGGQINSEEKQHRIHRLAVVWFQERKMLNKH